MTKAEAIAIAQDYVREQSLKVKVGEPKSRQMTAEFLDECFQELPPPSEAVRNCCDTNIWIAASGKCAFRLQVK